MHPFCPLISMQELCGAAAMRLGGYLVESADAWLLAAFRTSAHALAWGLACKAALAAEQVGRRCLSSMEAVLFAYC